MRRHRVSGTARRLGPGLFAATALWSSCATASPSEGAARYLDAPQVSAFAPAPSSARLAWVTTHRGGQTIRFGQDRARSRVLADFPRDDGLSISNLMVSQDERFVVFLRQGGPAQNPANDLSPPPRRLLAASVPDGSLRTVAEGPIAGAALSPDGRQVVYAVGGEVWLAGLDPVAAPRRLLTAAGRQRDLLFSPDGRRLAFVSDRSRPNGADYAFVGVFDLARDTLTYLVPGLGADQSPAWSPDSRRLAFVRVLSDPKSYRFTDFREGPPFSILVADATTGEGQAVFTADRGRGSWFNPLGQPEDYGRIHPGQNLIWSADDQLIFPWEKTGWRLVYGVPASGGTARLLTPGEFEVSSASLSPDGRRLVYVANPHARMRPRAEVLDLRSGQHEAVDGGGAMHREARFCGDGACVLMHAWDDAIPSALMIARAARLQPVEPSELGEAKLSATFARPETFSFPSTDGFVIEGVLYRPAATFAGPRPVIAYAHGGSRAQVFPGRVYAGDTFIQYLVSRGYAVAAINYRSGLGYGLAFREPERYGGRSEGRGDIDDFVALHRYLAAQPGLDAGRVGVFGGSYGGYVVSNLLARRSDLFAAGVSLSGVGDWVRELELDTGARLNARISERAAREDLAFRSSAISAVDSWRSPLLLIHGDADTSGHMEADLELAAALSLRGVKVEAMILPGETHTLSLWRSRVAAFDAIADFFDRTLASKAAAR